jgi:uncharacterized protein (TIGR03086 family)
VVAEPGPRRALRVGTVKVPDVKERQLSNMLALWRQVGDGFSSRVEAVGPADWSKATCCAEWNVAQLVDHAIGAQRLVPKALGATGDIDATGDDRVAVWNTVRAAADAAFRVPGAFDAQVTLPFGVMRAEDGLGFPFGDLLVHTWDLARAIGADDHLLGEACAIVLAQLEPIDALIRGPGTFGPRLEPTAAADIQDQLLAFVGRQV